jgi:flagellar basal-body rod modification protein FlgD
MSNVPSTGSASAPASTTPTTSAENPKSILGKDDFLKLMMTQLQHQDPMSPMNDQDFMGQMAQFSSLEQASNMAQTLAQMNSASQVSQGVSLIGHQVRWVDGETQTSGSGQVTGVTVADGTITVRVGEDDVSPSLITEVA